MTGYRNAPASPKLLGLPRQVTPQTYTEVQEEVTKTLADCPHVHGVFRMGSIGDPGISDLDIIIAVPHDAPLQAVPDIRDVHPDSRYVLMHSPFLISTTMLSRARYLAGISHLKRLAGDLPMPETDQAPRRVRIQLASRYALDILYFCCRALSLNTLQVRSGLCTLNTIDHLLNLLRGIIEPPQTAVALVAQIRDLRSAWFERLDTNQLWTRVGDAIPVCLSILEAIEAEPSPTLLEGEQVLSWMNMRATVTGQDAPTLTIKEPAFCRLLDRVPTRNLHVDDARWYLRTCLVGIGSTVGGALSSPPPTNGTPPDRERWTHIARYVDWFRDAPPRFSMLAPKVDTLPPQSFKWRTLRLARKALLQ